MSKLTSIVACLLTLGVLAACAGAQEEWQRTTYVGYGWHHHHHYRYMMGDRYMYHRHYMFHRHYMWRNGEHGYWGHRNGIRVWIRL